MLTRAISAARLNNLWAFARRQIEARWTIVRFGLVGGSGYVLYQAILFLVYDSPFVWFMPEKHKEVTLILFSHGDLRLLITTLLASALTLVYVFTGHNLWTFRDRDSVGKPLWLRFGQFVATAVTASAIITVTVNVLVLRFDMYHFIALPIGVALAGAWDWLWYTQLIWRRKRAEAHETTRTG